MTQKLKDIASIATGLYKKPDPSGNVYYLHGKHFDENGVFRTDAVLAKDIFIDDKLEKHLLQDKDILFIAKGDNNRACLYTADIGKAVASSLFFVIRVDPAVILPEYLVWFLNTTVTQSIIHTMARGSYIPSVSKKFLKDLKVSIPPINIQKKIIELLQIWRHEKEIMLQLLEEKAKLYEQHCLNLAKG
jgi:restriction endonuclease S subunit